MSPKAESPKAESPKAESPKTLSKKALAQQNAQKIRQALKDVMPSLEESGEALAALDVLEKEIAAQRAILVAQNP